MAVFNQINKAIYGGQQDLHDLKKLLALPETVVALKTPAQINAAMSCRATTTKGRRRQHDNLRKSFGSPEFRRQIHLLAMGKGFPALTMNQKLNIAVIISLPLMVDYVCNCYRIMKMFDMTEEAIEAVHFRTACFMAAHHSVCLCKICVVPLSSKDAAALGGLPFVPEIKD